MRAGLRLACATVGGGACARAGAGARAEHGPPAGRRNTPATDAIGPRELQNFSLNGTVTRPAEHAAGGAGAARHAAPTPGRAHEPPAAPGRSRRTARTPVRRSRPARCAPGDAPAPPPAAAVDLRLTATTATPAAMCRRSEPAPADDTTLRAGPQRDRSSCSCRGCSLAGVLGAGGGVPLLAPPHRAKRLPAARRSMLSSRRSRRPRPPRTCSGAVVRSAGCRPSGIVSTRLRPWLEIDFAPRRCVVEDEQATIEFEVAVVQLAAARRRARVLVEASMFNAGPTRTRRSAASSPIRSGRGERIADDPAAASA